MSIIRKIIDIIGYFGWLYTFVVLLEKASDIFEKRNIKASGWRVSLVLLLIALIMGSMVLSVDTVFGD